MHCCGRRIHFSCLVKWINFDIKSLRRRVRSGELTRDAMATTRGSCDCGVQILERETEHLTKKEKRHRAWLNQEDAKIRYMDDMRHVYLKLSLSANTIKVGLNALDKHCCCYHLEPQFQNKRRILVRRDEILSVLSTSDCLRNLSTDRINEISKNIHYAQKECFTDICRLALAVSISI